MRWRDLCRFYTCKADPVEKKLARYKQNGQIMLAGLKTLDTQNNSVIMDLSKKEEEEEEEEDVNDY
jgi:hypothetical protein